MVSITFVVNISLHLNGWYYICSFYYIYGLRRAKKGSRRGTLLEISVRLSP